MAVDRVQWGAERSESPTSTYPMTPHRFRRTRHPVRHAHPRRFLERAVHPRRCNPSPRTLQKPVLPHGASNTSGGLEEDGVWMDTLSDVLRACDYLSLIPGIDIKRSMVMGHSAGGQLALLMGAKAERRPWLAIAQAPITDLIGAVAKLSTWRRRASMDWFITRKTNGVAATRPRRPPSQRASALPMRMAWAFRSDNRNFAES